MAELGKRPMIYKALADVMAEVGAIEKSKRNSQQGFMYRGVDDVMNALNPILVKNRVILTTEVLEQTREERQTAKGGTLLYSICKVKFTFYAEDGSNVSSIILGEGMDSGDKASNKAMSVAYKYAFFQMFCIPTEEMVDPDGDTPENSTKERAKKKGAESNLKKPEPTPIAGDKGKEKISQEKAEALIGLLNEQEIKEETIFNLYKVNALTELSENQYANIIKNFERIKEKQEEKSLMNKVILMGRLTRDPEVNYSNGGSSIARFTLVVDRKFKREGDEQTADFISCIAFGKTAEFIEKYFLKGSKMVLEGHIQTGSYEKNGQRIYTTDVIVEQVEFAESKASSNNGGYVPADRPSPSGAAGDGFMNIPDGIDEELPFN